MLPGRLRSYTPAASLHEPGQAELCSALTDAYQAASALVDDLRRCYEHMTT